MKAWATLIAYRRSVWNLRVTSTTPAPRFGGIFRARWLPSLHATATALPNQTYIGPSLGITPSIVITPPPHSVDVRGVMAEIEYRPSDAPGSGASVVVGAVEAVVAVLVGVVDEMVLGGRVETVDGVVALGGLGAVGAGAAVVAVPAPEPLDPPEPPEPVPDPLPERGAVVAVVVTLPPPLPPLPPPPLLLPPPVDGAAVVGVLG